jgi:hypothetical protein
MRNKKARSKKPKQPKLTICKRFHKSTSNCQSLTVTESMPKEKNRNNNEKQISNEKKNARRKKGIRRLKLTI